MRQTFTAARGTAKKEAVDKIVIALREIVIALREIVNVLCERTATRVWYRTCS